MKLTQSTHWRKREPTPEIPCGGCRHVASMQGYFYHCVNPARPVSAYYGFMGGINQEGLKTCHERAK